MWLGSLIHTIGDDGAHLVLPAHVAEISRFKVHVKSAEGYLDLSQVATTDDGKAMLNRLIAGYAPRMVSDNPEEVLRKLVLLAYEEMDCGAQKQCRICLTFNVDCPKTVRNDGILAMAELGAEGFRKILDATLTAWEFAKRKTPVRLTEGLIGQARADVQRYLETKPLEHDTVYAGTLESRPAGAFVGVLVEPSTFMGEARFGWCGAVVQGQVMRTCREAGVPYRAVDIRRIEKEGMPGVGTMPVLVLTSGSFHCTEAPFRKYVQAGGRLLWIGGCDKGLLGKLSVALQPADPRLLPVSNKYEDPNQEVVAKVTVKFLGELGQSLGVAPRRFVNNPNTFGWTTPRCGLQVTLSDRDIKPLAAVSDGADSMIIAAAMMDGGRARHVFLPQYLLLPYTLAKDPMMDFSRPSLDSVGRKTVLGSLAMLAPELARADPPPRGR